VYISRIWGEKTPERIEPKFCLAVDVRDVITWFKFGGDRLRGLGSAEGRLNYLLHSYRLRAVTTPLRQMHFRPGSAPHSLHTPLKERTRSSRHLRRGITPPHSLPYSTPAASCSRRLRRLDVFAPLETFLRAHMHPSIHMSVYSSVN